MASMKSETQAKQARVALDAEEASLRTRLLALLPSVARDGAPLFVNSRNCVEKLRATVMRMQTHCLLLL
jgi:hypothetical protein